MQRGGINARERAGLQMRDASGARSFGLTRGGHQSYGGGAGRVRMPRKYVQCKRKSCRKDFCSQNDNGKECAPVNFVL